MGERLFLYDLRVEGYRGSPRMRRSSKEVSLIVRSFSFLILAIIEGMSIESLIAGVGGITDLLFRRNILGVPPQAAVFVTGDIFLAYSGILA